jgi:uncharacterized LabA/DUF88 family protein
MKRTAIFVDAGYLYAQGSACLQGSKAKRENLQLAHELFVARLLKLVGEIQPDASLLRIYWYDGTSRGPTQDHRTLADLDNLKLRLGFINSVGQQKGVDSLLVTDLVELSRNGAICDALLLGGDEDLRIGVQIAQSFGVRVHLLGIEPSRGSQSLQLRQEADTKHEFSSGDVASFLKLIQPVSLPSIFPLASSSSVVSVPASLASPASTEFEKSLQDGIQGVLQRLSADETADLAQAIEHTRAVPKIYDGRVLASCRTSLGRDLTMDEKKVMRALLTVALKK